MPFNYGLLTKAGAPTDGVDEVQSVTVDADEGTFTLTFDSEETDPIPSEATAAQVETALEALSTIGAGNVTVTGSAGGPFTATFSGSLSGKPVSEMTADGALLTGGAGTAVIATVTAGVQGDYRGSPVNQPLIDSTNRKIFENTGSRARPVWTEVSV